MKSHVIPTVFAHTSSEFEKRFATVIKVARAVQIDFMDGVLVPAKSINLSDVPDLKRYMIDFEAHLMVAHPRTWIEACRDKGFKRIIFHVEACQNREQGIRIINRVRKHHMCPMIAINPETPLRQLTPFINLVEGALVMGVHPGKEHQSLWEGAAQRVALLKKKHPNLWVQVDGGVHDKNIASLTSAGVDAVNSGSFVSDAKNPKKALELLENNFRKGKR